MKNSTIACLSLILGGIFAGCSAAPTNGVAVDSPKIPAASSPAGRISPSIIPTAEVEAPLAPVAKINDEIADEATDEMVSIPDPVKKAKKHSSLKNEMKIDMKARIALANQMMKDESTGSDAPVVCETKARRTPAGQLIYESSCH